MNAAGQDLDLGRSFAFASMTGHAFQAVIDDADAVALLRAVGRHLAPGGKGGSRLRFRDRDVMAALVEAAGLAARDWLGDWEGSPFDPASSPEIIAVIERRPPQGHCRDVTVAPACSGAMLAPTVRASRSRPCPPRRPPAWAIPSTPSTPPPW